MARPVRIRVAGGMDYVAVVAATALRRLEATARRDPRLRSARRVLKGEYAKL